MAAYRTASTWTVTLVVALLLAWGGSGRADSTAGNAAGEGGYWRLDTGNGPVHVWLPAGYDPDRAGVVVYVHGYRTDADRAWSEHFLAEQFGASGRNAVFIVPEAPTGPHRSRTWRRLGDLLDTVFEQTDLSRPGGELVAMGHSGAYRTLVSWLGYSELDTVISLDTMYGVERYFADWLEHNPTARLIDVTVETQEWSEALAERVAESIDPEAVVIAAWPDANGASLDELPEGAGSARLMCMRAHYEHMELVTSGQVIPVLLGLTDLEPVSSPVR
jgi:hypothetical protein